MALQASVIAKLAGKRDPDVENDVLNWCFQVIGEQRPNGAYEDILKDGVVLCKVMNKLLPGSCPKINTTGSNFKLMENLNAVQKAMKKYGVPEEDVFQTVDLFEKRNIPQVTQGIMALGRTCYLHPEYPGPYLGPKPSEEQKASHHAGVYQQALSKAEFRYGAAAQDK